MEVIETDVNNVEITTPTVDTQQPPSSCNKEADDQVKDMEVDEVETTAKTDVQNSSKNNNDDKQLNQDKESSSVSLNPVHHFNAISGVLPSHDLRLHESKLDSDWLVRAPQPIRMKQRSSFSQDQSGGDAKSSSFVAKKLFNTTKSAFNSKKKLSPTDLPSMSLFPADEALFKRCNSAPLPAVMDAALQDSLPNNSNGNSNSSLNASPKPVPRTNRSRCLSASVSCSKNLVSFMSPAPFGKNKFRLTQLIKEESIQGIQNKEKEHEREVQFSFQISNMSEVSLNDGNKTSTITTDATHNNDISFNGGGMMGNKSHSSSGSTTPTSVLAQSSIARCRLSPLAGPKPQDYQTTFFSPPSSCPNQTPLSPTRVIGNGSSIVGANNNVMGHLGRQIYSPLAARANSRSPSPSPTRKSFITRRRSQSPIVLRPSALGSTLKRKYDSDNEGCISPKRPTTSQLPITPTSSKIVAGFQMNQITPPSPAASTTSSDVKPSPHISPVAGSVTPPFRTRPHLQRPSSLANTLIFGRGSQQSPNHHHPGITTTTTSSQASMIFPPTPRTTHHHTTTFTSNPHALLSSSNSGSSERCSSPASSTCSSSSLEGLKDLQPTIHQPHYNQMYKKDFKSNVE